jgi:hypothetical protein
MMSHNVYQHIESVQRANSLADVATARFKTDYTHWRKLKPSSKEEVFDPWVPRNVVYLVNFIDELFKSETPFTMLENAAPMLADFNGKKTLTTSDSSFASLFEDKASSTDNGCGYSDEDTETASNFFNAL